MIVAFARTNLKEGKGPQEKKKVKKRIFIAPALSKSVATAIPSRAISSRVSLSFTSQPKCLTVRQGNEFKTKTKSERERCAFV